MGIELVGLAADRGDEVARPLSEVHPLGGCARHSEHDQCDEGGEVGRWSSHVSSLQAPRSIRCDAADALSALYPLRAPRTPLLRRRCGGLASRPDA